MHMYSNPLLAGIRDKNWSSKLTLEEVWTDDNDQHDCECRSTGGRMASSIASLVKYLLKYIFSISRLAVVIVGTVKNSDRLLCVSEYVFSVWECVCVQCVRVCVCSVCSVCVCSVCEWVYVFSVWVSVCVQCVSECMCFSVWVSVCVQCVSECMCECVCVFSVWECVCVQCVSECMCSVCEWVYVFSVWVSVCVSVWVRVCVSVWLTRINHRSTAQRTNQNQVKAAILFVGKYLIDWFFRLKREESTAHETKQTTRVSLHNTSVIALAVWLKMSSWNVMVW